jgi:hypothetical protein
MRITVFMRRLATGESFDSLEESFNISRPVLRVLILTLLLLSLSSRNKVLAQLDAVQDVFLGCALTVSHGTLAVGISALAFFMQTFALNLERESLPVFCRSTCHGRLNVLGFFQKVDADTASKYTGPIMEVQIELDGVEFLKLLVLHTGFFLKVFRLVVLTFRREHLVVITSDQVEVQLPQTLLDLW